MNSALLFRLFQACVILTLTCSEIANAVEWRGLIDARAVASDAQRSWTYAGLGKSRYDDQSGRLSLGQAVVRGDADLIDSLSASAVLSAGDQHAGILGVREAWLGWNPIPTGPWRVKVKVGFFFPPSSVEIDYDGVSWTPTRTISSSAINSWIGEELRTNGVELRLSRTGRYENSPHDYGLTAAVFNGNDSTGTLLAWRGWSISDRIAGRNETVLLPDLPVYRLTGPIPRQSRTIHPFREIDGRLGYYVGANYNYKEQVEITSLHYDNRADPMIVKDGQYSWHTRFNHLSMVVRPLGAWELLFQGMRGDTLMGANAVALDYQVWYALVSHPLWSGTLALRYDRFQSKEHDILPSDPNSEKGHALALAYSLNLNDAITLVTELLVIDSKRAARSLVGEPPGQIERSITSSIRWQF